MWKLSPSSSLSVSELSTRAMAAALVTRLNLPSFAGHLLHPRQHDLHQRRPLHLERQYLVLVPGAPGTPGTRPFSAVLFSHESRESSAHWPWSCQLDGAARDTTSGHTSHGMGPPSTWARTAPSHASLLPPFP